MDVQSAIKTRRSVRRYIGQPVTDELVAQVVEAGFYAASAHNLHPVHFIVVRDRDMLQKLSTGNPYGHMIAYSSAAIVVCGDKSAQQNTEFLYADCAAACQNILLQAHALGLGAVWCGVVSSFDWYPEIISLLSLPDGIAPVAVLALGYAQKTPEPVERFDAAKVHFEHW